MTAGNAKLNGEWGKHVGRGEKRHTNKKRRRADKRAARGED